MIADLDNPTDLHYHFESRTTASKANTTLITTSILHKGNRVWVVMVKNTRQAYPLYFSRDKLMKLMERAVITLHGERDVQTH